MSFVRIEYHVCDWCKARTEGDEVQRYHAGWQRSPSGGGDLCGTCAREMRAAVDEVKKRRTDSATNGGSNGR